MRLRIASLALVTLAGVSLSCSDQGSTGPGALRRPLLDVSTASLPPVRISEIHYDNTGADVGEQVEISGPAGTDVTGWKLIPYNGAGGASYSPSVTFSGTIPATCGARGVLLGAITGLQNGSPDGIALVNASNQVVEFLSYEGTFTATNGAAVGLVSVDIGVAEAGTEPVGQSLARSGSGTWSGPAANTFGACNDADEPPPPATVVTVTVSPATATVTQGATQTFTATAFDAASQPIGGTTFTWSSDASAIATVNASGVATGVAPGDANITATAPNGVTGSAALHVDAPAPPALPDTRLAEIHYDNLGTDVNEAIEVEGPAGTDLTGWSVVLYNGNGGASYNTRSLTGTIADLCDGRGVVVLSYPQDGIQNGAPDGFALVNGTGQVVEFLSYEGSFTAADGPAAGKASVDIGVLESSSPVGQSLQRNATGVWQSPAAATFGACNGGGGPPPPPSFSFTFTGRDPNGDPALPVGFQDQLFVTVRDGSGNIVTGTITWSSDTPALATIDQNGVFTALGAGSAVLRATTEGGATGTIALPTRTAVASTTAQYAGNTEFGEPTDADPSDDFIVRHDEYTSSYNRTRGTPNWVSYDLDITHFGAEDRCDCFTTDPALPASFTSYTTNAYTGSGTFAGYGIDRGHLARSFDRTSASLDNATTFWFTNIVPQAADLNQGPWAVMENYLGDLARFQNKEVYIIAGVAGSKGTLKNEGIVTIPASVWKVAVILPRDQGLGGIRTWQDLEVVAVIMPNDPGIRNVDWQTYRTTVDAVEALSGYDVLALLPDQVEIAVESGTRPPVAAVNGPFTGLEGSPVAMSAAGSTDPDGDALTFAWSFGDGGTGTGADVAHTYAQDGTYQVLVVATDIRGLVDTARTTVTAGNVAPEIGAFDGATLLRGETYTAGGTFTDPGADTWTATVDYGDGAGSSSLGLSGMSFSLSHPYALAGTFTVTVRVTDGIDTALRTATVTVLTPAQGALSAIAMIDQLIAGGSLSAGNGNSLKAKLNAAIHQLDHDTTPAINQLEALFHELDALVRTHRLPSADADALAALVRRVIASVAS